MANYTYFVSSGQNMGSLVLNGQSMYVDLGGTATNITVRSNSHIKVDGYATKVQVNSGGSLGIYRGSAANAELYNGGSMAISSGGMAVNTTMINGGVMYIINGKAVLTVMNGGTLNVGFSSGHLNKINALANNTTANNNAAVNVSSGGTALATVLNGGAMHVSSGGHASGTEIKNNGKMFISSAGSAENTAIASGGTLTLNDNASHYGSLQIADGGKVIAADNANIYFEIAGQKPSNKYIINDLSRIEGDPDYCITISNSQAAGTYKLSANAADIKSMSVTVQNEYFHVSVNEEGFIHNGKYHYLTLNEAAELSFTVSALPDAPKITPDTKLPTNDKVTLEAEFGKNCATKEYSFNETEWFAYTAPITVTDNITVYFRSGTAEGLISQTASYTVSNIDRIAPEITAVTPEFHPKNLNAVISIETSDASGIRSIEYKTADGEWQLYNAKKPPKISTSGDFHIRAVDTAGNYTEKKTTFEFTPIAADDWQDMKTNGDKSEFIGKAEYTGNGEIEINDWVGLDDVLDYKEITLSDAGKYSFELTATDKTKFTVYQLIQNKNGTYKLKSLQNTTLKYDKNEAVYSAETKGLLLDAGTYYLCMTSTNAKTGAIADYTVISGDNTIFSESQNGHNDDWQDMKTNGGNSEFIGSANYDENGNVAIENWVGFGDASDYFKIDIADAGKYNFELSADGKTKFTVYQLIQNKNGTYKLKSLQNTTLKYDKNSENYQAVSKDLWLADGTYYISMTSTDAKKGGNSAYSINSNAVTIYEESKNGHNDDWQDLKTNGGSSEFIGDAEFNENGQIEITDWVGLGDAVDYKKLTIEETTKLSLSVSAEDKAKFTIYKLDENKNGTYKLKSVKSSTLAKQKYFYIEAVPFEPIYKIPEDPTLPKPVNPILPSTAPKPELHAYQSYIDDLILEEGTYYIAMTSTNAAKGGNASYKIKETSSETVINEFADNSDDKWKDVTDSAAFQVGDTIHNWVGFGDTKDFFKLELNENGKLRFSAAENEETFYDIETLNALSDKDIKITCLTEKGKSVALIYDDFDYTSKQELAAGTYYIGIQSTNAKKNWTEYNISIEIL